MVKHTKVTFTVDETTIARLNDAARRLSIPKSEVVREAIHDYHQRIGRLGEAERRRMLADFDRLVPRIPARSSEDVDKEIGEIRRMRRRGGRRTRGSDTP